MLSQGRKKVELSQNLKRKEREYGKSVGLLVRSTVSQSEKGSVNLSLFLSFSPFIYSLLTSPPGTFSFAYLHLQLFSFLFVLLLFPSFLHPHPPSFFALLLQQREKGMQKQQLGTTFSKSIQFHERGEEDGGRKM